jgi:hypothetical protein
MVSLYYNSESTQLIRAKVIQNNCHLDKVMYSKCHSEQTYSEQMALRTFVIHNKCHLEHAIQNKCHSKHVAVRTNEI